MNKEKVLGGIDEDFIKSGAAEIEDDDIRNVIDKASDIKRKVLDSNLLKRFAGDVKLLIAMIKDYWNGAYREISWWTIAAVAFALLYILNPIDLIPDVIPIIGLLDDAAVLGLCLAMIENDIQAYQKWKKQQDEPWEV